MHASILKLYFDIINTASMAADKLTQLQESLEEPSGAPLRRQTTKSFHPSFAGEVEKNGLCALSIISVFHL